MLTQLISFIILELSELVKLFSIYLLLGRQTNQTNLSNLIQDAANAVMGIVVDHIEPYIYWKPKLLDAILKYGDRLYTLSLPNASSPPKLCPTEIQKEFHVTSFNVSR